MTNSYSPSRRRSVRHGRLRIGEVPAFRTSGRHSSNTEEGELRRKEMETVKSEPMAH